MVEISARAITGNLKASLSALGASQQAIKAAAAEVYATPPGTAPAQPAEGAGAEAGKPAA